MITTETKQGKTTVTFTPEKNVPIQEEIVQNISIVMLALRDNLKKAGANDPAIDVDADKIFKSAYVRYHNAIISGRAENLFKEDSETVSSSNFKEQTKSNPDLMKNVMNQVDSMLKS